VSEDLAGRSVAALTAEALTSRLTAAERDRGRDKVVVRDAASLIILDRTRHAVLMGRRNARAAFFPGAFVFPGGRVDPSDSRVAAAPYHPATAAKLGAMMRNGGGEARSRALGIAALREAYEETGVLIARPGPPPAAPAFAPFAARGLALDLSPLRYVLRAITPPGRPRRFDTRFFVVDREAIADTDPSVVGEDAELEAVDWMPLDAARRLKLPTITLTVLDELEERLAVDPELAPDGPVPFYRWRRTGFTRELI
jgi:8-oxo-dGTP pyrophosphatase MutT (NUDIX family)